MTICKIDGKEYKVLVTAIEENFDVSYSDNSGRTLGDGAKMTLDPLGTFYGHTVTVKRRKGYEVEFDALYDCVSKPRYNGMQIEIVHNQRTIKYEAYVTSGARKLKRVDEKRGLAIWDELTINFVSTKAQVLPL